MTNVYMDGTQGGPPRILLVEDQFLVAFDMVEQLKAEGYLVVGPANSLREALSLVETTPIDAGLLDVNLGACSSYPVAEALIEKGIPFAFLSGHSSGDLKPDFREHSLITKPVHPNTLRETVLDLVGRVPQRRLS